MNLPPNYPSWMFVVKLFSTFVVTLSSASDAYLTIHSEPILDAMNERISCLEKKIDSVSGTADDVNIQGFKSCRSIESKVFSLSSRVIEIENAIGSVAELDSELKLLRTSLAEQKSKMEELTKRVRQLEPTLISPEADAICRGSTKVSDTEFSQNFSLNILRGKSANASTVYSTGYQVYYGIDGDFHTRYSSAQETDPWFLVDLQSLHLVTKIRFTLYRDSRVDTSYIKLYAASGVDFIFGKPDLQLLQPFGQTSGGAQNTLTTEFVLPEGRCGRYIIVARGISNNYLTFWELGAEGYPLA